MTQTYKYWNGARWVPLEMIPTVDGDGVTWKQPPEDWQRGGTYVDENGVTRQLDDLYYIRAGKP